MAPINHISMPDPRMQKRRPFCSAAVTLLALSLFSSAVKADDSLTTTSFNACSSSNQVTVSSFDASLWPGNNTLAYSLQARNTFEGQGLIDLAVIIDGEMVVDILSDPCSSSATNAALCPFTSGPIVEVTNVNIPDSFLSRLPDDILTTTDLDAHIRMRYINARTNRTVGCVDATLTNSAGEVAANNGTNTTESGSETNNTSSDSPPSSANALFLDWNVLLFTLAMLGFWTTCV